MANKTVKTNPKTFDITKFTFVGDTLLIRAVRDAGVNGLVDPQQYEDKPEYGEVVKAGDNVVRFKQGQIVRFGKYSSELIRSDGEDYFIVHEEDVHAYLPE
jgi:co-chaperonin GroES (HSP10)